MLPNLAKILLVAGGVLVLAGLVLLLAGKLGLGRLPGDIVVRREGFTLYLPLMTMLLLSLALTLVINLILRLFR